MKIKYEFANGDVVEVEVDDSVGKVIVESRVKEASYERKMRRHCYSLDAVDDKSSWQRDNSDEEMRVAESAKLSPRERMLDSLSHLTQKQKNLLEELYVKGKTQEEYAKEKGISQAAVSQQLNTIRKKMKKLF